MKILAVVVRYKASLQDSETINSIVQNFSVYPELADKIEILIWDNSPSPLSSEDIALPFKAIYRHSSSNLGVSGAYNAALKYAEQINLPWLLLLDQDSSLPPHFLMSIYGYAEKLLEEKHIAAVAPFLVDGNLSISPGEIKFNRVKLLKPPLEGVPRGILYAANSGTLMRVESLREIGGFDEEFWLDLSDIVVFHRLYAKGKFLYVAGDLRVPHKVTLNDYDGSMSPQRYINFVSAESAYWDSYRSFWENSIQTARLFLRAVKQRIRYENKAYAKITLQYALARVFRSRGRRLCEWRQRALARNLPLIEKGKVVS